MAGSFSIGDAVQEKPFSMLSKSQLRRAAKLTESDFPLDREPDWNAFTGHDPWTCGRRVGSGPFMGKVRGRLGFVKVGH